jgi:hypothetical protein
LKTNNERKEQMKTKLLLLAVLFIGCAEQKDSVFVKGEDGYSVVAHSHSANDLCGLGRAGTQVTLALDLDRTFTFSTGDLVQTQFTTCDGVVGAQGLGCNVTKSGAQSTLTCGTTSIVINDGENGMDGLSAYEVWVSLGNSGSEVEFINSLRGPKGDVGSNGASGLSAYQIWISLGNTGTESQFINSLVGPQGPAGAAGVSPSGIFITEFLNPCNNEFAHDEILMRMSNGKVVAVFDGGPHEDRLTFLVPGTEYITTDRNTNNQCRFKITESGTLTGQKLCQGSSNNCSSIN